jgi:5-methylcytosine-specific restriction endonuclease McrA
VPKFADIITGPEHLMGVKAVWGESRAPIMCFGSRGDPNDSPNKHFQAAKSVADRAAKTPFMVTLGGGRKVPEDLDGRVLEVARATGVWGETRAFIGETSIYPDLQEWPVAVVLSEVYRIEGGPHINRDLGFADRDILTNAFDGVIRREKHIEQLWRALAGISVEQRRDLLALPGFVDRGKVIRVGSFYPKVSYSSPEGKEIWRKVKLRERDPLLRKNALCRNRSVNGGRIKCESCDFSDEASAVFDAHHLTPLAVGLRETRLDDLAILCPICHRLAHLLGPDRLNPLRPSDVRVARLKRGHFGPHS